MATLTQRADRLAAKYGEQDKGVQSLRAQARAKANPQSAQEMYTTGAIPLGTHDRRTETEVSLDEESRQALIDEIVSAAHSDADVDFALSDLFDDFEIWDYGDSPFFLTPIPIDSIRECLTDESLREALRLNDAEDITDEDRRKYAHSSIKSLFNNPDADAYAMTVARPITDSSGRTALVTYEVSGYSFSGVDYCFCGVFPDEESALESIQCEGEYDSYEEFCKEFPDILQVWKRQ